MKILLTGSRGFIGKHISLALKESGHEVIEASRTTAVDFNKMEHVIDWLPHLKSVDVVINCVGIIVETKTQRFSILHTLAPSALFSACEQAGVSRVIQLSALGADDNAFTQYQLSKKKADDVLRNLSLDWFILRPSLVYGGGGASTKLFKRLAKLPIVPLVDRGEQQIQPVHIMDLVDVVLACLTTKMTKQTIDVVGPEAMTFAEWLHRLRNKYGKERSFIIPLPYKLMLSMSSILQHFIPLLHPDNLRMLQQGNTSNDDSMLQLLGRTSRVVP